MNDKSKIKKTEKIENLELNRETVEDLTESEAEQGQGGRANTGACDSLVDNCNSGRPLCK